MTNQNDEIETFAQNLKKFGDLMSRLGKGMESKLVQEETKVIVHPFLNGKSNWRKLEEMQLSLLKAEKIKIAQEMEALQEKLYADEQSPIDDLPTDYESATHGE